MSILRNEVNKILKGIKEGDVSKQQELIESTCNFLKVISYKYLYNKDDVEDVVMEAYMKVYRSIDSCDLSLDGYNWICKSSKTPLMILTRSMRKIIKWRKLWLSRKISPILKTRLRIKTKYSES